VLVPVLLSSIVRPVRSVLAQRRPAALLLTLAVLATAAAAALPQAAAAGASPRCYRGLGAWVDMYDAAAWDDPAAAVKDMREHGVRTLFLETANYHNPTSETMFRRADAGELIRQAHAGGMKVVAWYLPGFENLAKDYRRSMAAIDYRTPDGDKFDSFALDVEASIVRDASLRSRRLLTLSSRIREAVGGQYPLGAIIPSPAGMKLHSSYWPDFPYQALADIYDVFVPMGYYTYHGDGYGNAYRDTRDNIRIIRESTGRPSIPIHVIAGAAAKSSAGETTAYVRALREHGALGGSIYDWASSGPEDWAALRNVRFNPRQRPTLPQTLPLATPMGYFGADRSHPKEVFYETTGQDGDRVLRFRLYDVQADEVRLVVNWQDLGPLRAGPVKSWTGTRAVTIPAAALEPTARNVIGFVARGDYPVWRTWAVRDVSLDAP
jgi:hypothetical protein